VSDRVVIVGGGIAGLLAAALIKRLHSRAEIVVLEQSGELGGLLRRVDGGRFGSFDLGMHTLSDTGVPDLDDFLWALLPEDEWDYFSGEKRDLSGVYFNKALQRDTHYPDLRTLDGDGYRRCLADLFMAVQAADSTESGNMRDYGRARFGPAITELVIDPVIRKMYGHQADRVDVLAARILPLDRIVLFDEGPFKDLMLSPCLRARIAYPNQRTLPTQYASGRGSYYPKRHGIYRVINALAERLKTGGVSLLTNVQVASISRDRGTISSLTVRRDGDTIVLDGLDRVFWTAGLVPLAKQLDLWPKGFQFDPPRTTVIANFLFDRPLEFGDLYYFYSHDPRHATFRVTNFAGYCTGAARAGGLPVCAEMLVDHCDGQDEGFYRARALSELADFGILQDGTQTLFSAIQLLPAGFPMLTCKNTAALEGLRTAVKGLELSNLAVCGILAERGVFFQTDVMIDTHRKVTQVF
jgi:protoporphyrinogen oxidase